MNKQQSKFKLGTADTLLVAVGTLAVDYISTSQYEIVEVQPGGKKVYTNIEEFEKKIKQYGIKKGKAYPGSSLGNFLNQAQQLSQMDPSYGPVHLVTTLALKDPTSKFLLDSISEKGMQYAITNFDEENALNPIACLVESKGYTKILSFKDPRIPVIEVHPPKKGRPGVVMIGVAAGNGVQSKLNALNFATKHNLPIGVLTAEGEVNQLGKNPNLREINDKIMRQASFFAANEDEVRKILYVENPSIKPSHDRVHLAQQLREVFNNDNLDILLSFGSEGSLFLFGNTAVIVKVPKIPHHEIVSTAGAGDALAGAFVEAVRIKGMDLEGVCWSLTRANRTAQNVVRHSDTRAGQATAEQFLEKPSSDYEIEVVHLKPLTNNITHPVPSA